MVAFPTILHNQYIYEQQIVNIFQNSPSQDNLIMGFILLTCWQQFPKSDFSNNYLQQRKAYAKIRLYHLNEIRIWLKILSQENT